jgi:photosystem II stability/assembly factor-like uncharacterized protein
VIDEMEVAARFRATFGEEPSAGAAERLRAEILRPDARVRASRKVHSSVRVSLRVVAAVVLVAMVIGAGSALLALHLAVTRSVPSGPAMTNPRPWSSSIGENDSRAVGMVSPSVGWQVTSRGSGVYVVLRTTDAGAHWVDVSPPAGELIGKPAAFYILDGQHIWLTQTVAAGAQVRIYTVSTADGGRTWSQGASVAVPSLDYPTVPSLHYPYGAGSILSLDFVDPVRGWLLSEPIYDWSASGPGPQTAHLYRTIDRGATWTEIAHTVLGPVQETVNGQTSIRVGSHCWWDAISFATVEDGWLAQDGPCWGTVAQANSLLVTHDGGVTWSPEVIVDPAAGWFPVIVAAPAHVILQGTNELYVSADSGLTWSTRPLPTEPTSWDFADASHGWVWAFGNPTANGLYRTTDGGATWAEVNPSPPFQNNFGINVDLQFVDAKDGFAIGSPASDATITNMWKTGDGGRTWQLVGPVAP